MDREWNDGVAAAVDVTLLSRYYERFADHAVEIGRRVIFQLGRTECIDAQCLERVWSCSRDLLLYGPALPGGIAEHRRLGELVQTTAGKWISHPPAHCPNGHTLGPGEVLVGHQACLGHGGGHTT